MKKSKFNFKHFDKVVVRNYNGVWCNDFYQFYDEINKHTCVGGYFDKCLPYNEDTAKLINTNDDYEPPYKPNDGDIFNETEIEFDDSINWEQRRYEISKDMLAAIESNSNPQISIGSSNEQVKWAIEFADELIKQLKGE